MGKSLVGKAGEWDWRSLLGDERLTSCLGGQAREGEVEDNRREMT